MPTGSLSYASFSFELQFEIDRGRYTIENMVLEVALFVLASVTMDEDFHQCEVPRLSILLENNLDPRQSYPVIGNFCLRGKPTSYWACGRFKIMNWKY